MEFFFAFTRHTRTKWNDQRRYSGQANPHLDEIGIEQAKLLGESLQLMGLHYIYTSDLTRCTQTADLINRTLDIPVIQDDRLREVHMGAMTGLVKEVAQVRYPLARHKTKNRQFDFRDIGGESAEDVIRRHVSFFEMISRRHSPIAHWGPKILVLGHGTSLRRWFQHIGAEWDMPQGTYQTARLTL
jgi:probable phosphoglycerate mutase